jgi:hypothetical protein
MSTCERPNPYEGCQEVSLSEQGFGYIDVVERLRLGFFGTYPLRVRTELFSG